MCKKRLNIYEKIGKESTEILKNEIRNYYKTKSRKLELETSIDHTPNGKPRSVTMLVKDGIITSKQLIPDRGQDRRTKALCEVLCSINEKEYSTLKEIFSNGKVLIQIPDKRLAGRITRVKRFADSILYLSPVLEEHSYLYVKNVCAHEIAHLLLHSDFSTKKKMSLVEKEAELKSVEWGF